jgi:serine/threonine protein kinase
MKPLKERKGLGLAVDVNELQKTTEKSFCLTSTGTFKEGDLAINKKGLLIKGESPKNSPHNSPPLNKDAPNHPTEDSIVSFELKDLQVLKVIGHGSGGVVQKTLHMPSRRMVALKIITLDIKESVRKQIILELKTLYRTQSDYVVTFFDAFYTEGSIFIALEYMDGGSLADLLRANGHISERILAYITAQVLRGLQYLHKSLHLIHRDIKPSNLLLNTRGQVKIADFGVSGQLAHTLSKAVTWVGTVTYMSPERISGRSYSFDSDIWSLGLALVECALGRYPYSPPNAGAPGEGVSFWELLDFIVKAPAPTLPPDRFSPEFCAFVAACLQKEPEERPTATMLLEHPFIKKYANENFDIASWVQSLVDRG